MQPRTGYLCIIDLLLCFLIGLVTFNFIVLQRNENLIELLPFKVAFVLLLLQLHPIQVKLRQFSFSSPTNKVGVPRPCQRLKILTCFGLSNCPLKVYDRLTDIYILSDLSLVDVPALGRLANNVAPFLYIFLELRRKIELP